MSKSEAENLYVPIIERSLVDQGQHHSVKIVNDEVATLIKEFDQTVTDAIACVGFSIAGFPGFRSQTDAMRAASGKANPGINLTTSDEAVGFYARWTHAEVQQNLRNDGLAGKQLAAQLIVYLYTLWEEEYRQRFALAHGLTKKNDLKVQEFADLGYLRNDIIHHRGIAKNASKCRALRWFEPGDMIVLSEAHLFELVTKFPWRILATGLEGSAS